MKEKIDSNTPTNPQIECYRASRELSNCEMGVTSRKKNQIKDYLQSKNNKLTPQQIMEQFNKVVDDGNSSHLQLTWGRN